VGACPVHQLDELGPVVDVLERQLLDRRAGDDEAVEALVAHLAERRVVLEQVLRRGVLRLVRLHVQELDLDLQGGVAEQAQQLRLGDHLRRHQVEDREPQRADVLVQGAVLAHDEDVLALENAHRGQRVGNLDGQSRGPRAAGDGSTR
jgi:hypothetical protein